MLHECTRWTSYRLDDVRGFAESRLDSIRQHRKPEGGFSFLPGGTGKVYYGARVAEGLPESDVHGTHLLVWAATLISSILGFRSELDWRFPVT